MAQDRSKGFDIKSLFFKSDPNSEASNPVAAPVSNPQPAPVQSSVTDFTQASSGMSSQSSAIQSDPAIVQELYKKVIGSNLPGPDYLELKQMAKPLESFIPDTGKRYEAAAQQIKSTNPGFNVTVAKDSLSKYIGIVNTAEKSWLDEFENNRKEKSAQYENDIKSFEDKCADIDKRIEEMKAQKADYEKILAEKRSAVTKYTSEFDSKKAVYQASAAEVRASLEADAKIIGTLNF